MHVALIFVSVLCAVKVVTGCSTLPTDPPDFSSRTQQLQAGVLYIYDTDSDCSGCLTALNLCYKPSNHTNHSSERILTAVFINSKNIIVYTHDVYVDPISDREQQECMMASGYCCVKQNLKPSERFFVRQHNLGLRTYSGVSSPLSHRNQMIDGISIVAPSNHNEGSSLGYIDPDEDMVNLPMFYFNITSSKNVCIIIA